ncbi:S-layer homology domain-containing protein [Oscillibacter sp.]|uniref:S-layer homology domain-containing protein n=1 Tax=Oscillibacter sp. TaxID=1945593 RepID=UPI001B3D9796|nr:S-layer homology domain-containing protein [Oscillibacter sp.]MBP3509468.1 S-layer homology domain-containing protein [Oscillibacter sp.]
MKKFLSLVLALVMTMSLVTISAGAKDFTDADKVTYTEAVDVLSAVKVIDGYTDGAFKPTTQLNRGQAAKILCNMILGPTTASALKADAAPFKDVAADNTFAAYIAYCAKEGIIDGYTDGTFRPTAPLTGYAFMKLLLGALGYDKDVEGYNGPNWSINVAKRALNIGLDDGLVEDFDGTKIVTREEACLFALNTLKATMVQYDTKTTVSVGGAEVVIAGSKAEDVENKAVNQTIKNDGKMQFAEKYFTNLKKQADRDDFYRPATTWKVKAEKVGTYTDTPDLTYTKGVKNGAIYSDLGSKVAKENVSVYINGLKKDDKAVAIAKGGDTKVGAYGNGVLTEVYYDSDNETAEIIQVITYVGEVEKTVKATSSKDAYIVLSDASVIANGAAPAGKLTFETDEKFDDEAIVLYTYSEMEGVEKVESVKVAEAVTGTVTRAENKDTNNLESQNLTIDGETYKTAYKFGGDEVGTITVKEDYTAYLDEYGYAIKVEKVADLSSEYALLLGYKNGSDWSTNKALLVFADGTKKIVDTDKDYKKSGTTYQIPMTDADSDGMADAGAAKIVTWKVNADGEYALREVKASGTAATKYSAPSTTNLFDLKTDRASIVVNKADDSATETVYGNSASVFVVNNVTNDDWDSYTGVKAAPTVKPAALTGFGSAGIIDNAAEKVSAYYYVKNGMVKVMFVMPGNDALVSNSATKVMFVAGKSVSNLIHDADGDYFEYNAVVNGEIKTVKVADTVGYSQNGFYSNYNFDKHDVITGMTPKTTGGSDTVYSAKVGINKTSADYTVLFDRSVDGSGNVSYGTTRTVADDAAIYYVDEDGVITESTYKAIVKDDNDLVYAIEKDGMINTLFIQEVDDDEIPAGPIVNNGYTASATITGSNAITVKVKNGTSALDARNVAIKMLQDAEYTNIVANNATSITATKNGVTETFTLTVEKAYKITFTTADSNVVCSPASTYAAEGDMVKVEVTNGYANWDTVRTWTPSGMTVTAGTATGTGKVQTVPVTIGNISADGTVTLAWS